MVDNNILDKHAYCIIAHSEKVLLHTLLRLLDDPLNDIYLLIDAKSSLRGCKLPELSCSRLYVVPSIKIWWGEYSQIDAELRLFEYAHNNGRYSYYHLLSGVDMPIKSQKQIHEFFRENNGAEFVELWNQNDFKTVIYKRLRKHYFHNYKRIEKRTMRQSIVRFAQRQLLSLNKKFSRKPTEEWYASHKMGPNWVSVTDDFIAYLLSKKKEIKKEYSHSFCADEIFLQSVLFKSPFYSNVYRCDEKTGTTGGKDIYGRNMRLIDWDRGEPYTFTSDDIPEITKSDCLFVRKVDSNDEKLLNYIVSMVKS